MKKVCIIIVIVIICCGLLAFIIFPFILRAVESGKKALQNTVTDITRSSQVLSTGIYVTNFTSLEATTTGILDTLCTNEYKRATKLYDNCFKIISNMDTYENQRLFCLRNGGLSMASSQDGLLDYLKLAANSANLTKCSSKFYTQFYRDSGTSTWMQVLYQDKSKDSAPGEQMIWFNSTYPIAGDTVTILHYPEIKITSSATPNETLCVICYTASG